MGAPTQPTTTLRRTTQAATTSATAAPATLRLEETLLFQNPSCVATTVHVYLVEQSSVHSRIASKISSSVPSASQVSSRITSAPVEDGVELIYSFVFAVDDQAAAEAAAADLASELYDIVKDIDYPNPIGCIFFNGINVTRTNQLEIETTSQDAEDSSNGSSSESGNMTLIPVIAVVAVLLMALLVVVVNRTAGRRDSGDFFTLGPATGAVVGVGGELSNPMTDARERNVAFDNPIYDDLDIDDDGSVDGDISDEDDLMPVTVNGQGVSASFY